MDGKHIVIRPPPNSDRCYLKIFLTMMMTVRMTNSKASWDCVSQRVLQLRSSVLHLEFSYSSCRSLHCPSLLPIHDSQSLPSLHDFMSHPRLASPLSPHACTAIVHLYSLSWKLLHLSPSPWVLTHSPSPWESSHQHLLSMRVNTSPLLSMRVYAQPLSMRAFTLQISTFTSILCTCIHTQFICSTAP